jgi:GT2 family glycosyltransferase
MRFDKITIAITAYERIDFFEEALDSALNQTIPCPIIVIDNASSHNKFEEIIFKKKSPKITYIRNDSNIGIVGSSNRCIIELCQTEYLTILHDDDALHPNFIEHCLDVLDSTNEKNCCIDVYALIGNDSTALLRKRQPNTFKKREFKTKHFVISNLSPFPGVVFPVSVAKKLNGFDPKMLPIIDVDFWIRLSENIVIYKTNFVYAFYRNSGQQASSKIFREVINKSYTYMKKYRSKCGKITCFFSLLRTYTVYCYYLNSYGLKSNISEDIQDVNLRKWFSFFRKTNKGIVRYFYICSYKIFSFILYNT